MSTIMRWLLPQVGETLSRHGAELRIDADALDRWEPQFRLPAGPPLPDAYTAIGLLAAESEAAVAAGEFRILHGGAGSQGAALLGRFCQRDDALRRHVDAYLRAEETLRPD